MIMRIHFDASMASFESILAFLKIIKIGENIENNIKNNINKLILKDSKKLKLVYLVVQTLEIKYELIIKKAIKINDTYMKLDVNIPSYCN